MPVTREDVIEAYRWILGRKPESEAVVEKYLRHDDVGTMRLALLRSAEFTGQYTALRPKEFRIKDADLEQPRIVFLHIMKTGGTTFHEILANHFDAPLICPERLGNLGAWTLDDLARFRLFSGHFDYQSCLAIPGRNKKIVTLLREPKARLLSYYYFLKAHRPEFAARNNSHFRLARELAPEPFFEHPDVRFHPDIRDKTVRLFCPGLPETQWRTLGAAHPFYAQPSETIETAWRQLQGLAGFGIMEQFDKSLAVLSAALGLALKPVAPRQVLADMMRTRPQFEPVERQAMTPALDGRLNELTALDRELYRRAVPLFDQRYRTIPGAADIDSSSPRA
ncbi:MAG TPA: sulfotransferase domain-containing protein [Stellaceae bacterium]|nr:sulfotransferase domain-containing protein [Stellaceae bacterium]